MNATPTFRPLTRSELGTVLSWAAAEGWNPGLHDADAFWAADPEGFYGMFLDDELIGSASIVSYGGRIGFVGLFIVKPEYRGRRLGTQFWNFFIPRLDQRLPPGTSTALDGVFAMQPYYAKSGFTFTHRNLRMEGLGRAAEPNPFLSNLSGIPFGQIVDFDARHFGAPRPDFLRHWIAPAGGLGLAHYIDGQILGLGVIRPCLRGYKIGPLFADKPEIAENIHTALSAHASGQPFLLDIPEINPAACALAARHGLKEVFGCAHMVRGSLPSLPWKHIFGITTFELG